MHPPLHQCQVEGGGLKQKETWSDSDTVWESGAWFGYSARDPLSAQVCGEQHRFEKLMEYFRNEDSNIDFMVSTGACGGAPWMQRTAMAWGSGL